MARFRPTLGQIPTYPRPISGLPSCAGGGVVAEGASVTSKLSRSPLVGAAGACPSTAPRGYLLAAQGIDDLSLA